MVMQDLNCGNISLKSVALSPHVNVEFPLITKPNKSTVAIKCVDEAETKEIEDNSLFRLVSTGVDIDNRIKADTSV